jgi:hypothetical protein
LPISSQTARDVSTHVDRRASGFGIKATTSPAEASIATGLAGHARTGIFAVWAFGTSLGFAVLIAGLFRIGQRASRSSRASGRWRVIADEVSRARGLRRPVRLLLSPHAQGRSQDPPLRIGGQIQAPRKLRDVRPACPSGSLPLPAIVSLSGRIGIDGLLTDVRDESADPQPSFVASAVDAASQWEFSPTLLNGVPVETNIRISMEYRAPR